MKSFQAHRAILPRSQQILWVNLERTPEMGFVLYGGTALALRLGHRESIDFDFFSNRPFEKRELYQKIAFLEDAQVVQDEPNTLTVLAPVEADFVKVSFFGSLHLGRVGEPEITDDHVLQVASIDDLFGTKIKALLDRVEAKDYRDVIALLRAQVPLERGLAAARALFGRAFQASEALKALSYFEGGDLAQLSSEERSTLIEAARTVWDIPAMPLLATTLLPLAGVGEERDISGMEPPNRLQLQIRKGERNAR